jgi:hypothetical protein
MSIDLATKIEGGVELGAELPQIAIILRDILGTSALPTLRLEVLRDGKRWPALTSELRDRSTPFFLISIEGEPETVGLWTDGCTLTVTMAAQRTKLEYALGAAVAIAIAKKFGGRIEDDWGFFGPTGEVCGDALLERLRARDHREDSDFRTCAEGLSLGDERRLQ